MSQAEQSDPALIPAKSRFFTLDNLTSPRIREARTGYFEIELDGRKFLPRAGEWKTHRDGTHRLRRAHRIALAGETPRY
jgi:hypothetical protein